MPPTDARPVSALPSVGARALAFLGILAGGVCGALIGFAFAKLQASGDRTVPEALGMLLGATIGAGGVAVVAVLGLRAMGEWRGLAEARLRQVDEVALDAMRQAGRPSNPTP